jgi:hypothetical protein
VLSAELPVKRYVLEEPDMAPVSQIFTFDSGVEIGITNSVPCVKPKVDKALAVYLELKNAVVVVVFDLRFIDG